MIIKCDSCERELDELGALLFSPPDENNNCTKYHICVYCFQKPNIKGSLAQECHDLIIEMQDVNGFGIPPRNDPVFNTVMQKGNDMLLRLRKIIEEGK